MDGERRRMETTVTKNCIPKDKGSNFSTTAEPEFVISDKHEEVGRLIFKDGLLRFEGNIEESVKVFFTFFQQTIDDYIAKKRKGCCHA